ncbi:MAG TPA: response regulator [Candidatus Limnocylindria bacterium]|nr:response regulator [Candidatus Limnocylindria bacterium]
MNSKVNILLVDDEDRNLDVLESVLQSEDYHLVRALTAERALLALIEGEFAVIVLDIRMPEMNGLELANLIKQRRRTQHIPIIFLTAYFQEDKDVLEGYDIGAVDYITKPVNPQILRSKIAVFAELFCKTRALSETNSALEQEIGRRQSAEEALRQANAELERRVEERTADLIRVNGELLEREKEVALARDRALAASQAKDDFVARLSHELRTPLNPVLLIASDAAANALLPPDVRADFQKISEYAALEARLIDDLLDVTRISQGKLTLEMRPFDPHSAIRDVIAMVQGEVDGKRLVLHLSLRAATHAVIGDDVRLRQIFWNVLKNAVKFTPPEGQITVETETRPEDGHFLVRVSDTGIGMTAEEISRIFDAFSQGNHAVQPGAHRFGGLGLGLAISRMLVELHGGSINAASPGRGEGATFFIELPLPVAGEAGLEPVQYDGVMPSPLLPGGARRRILLVEDHQPTARALVLLLQRRNYDVRCATSLSEARALAAQATFDLLISDIGLPDGNGCDLMSELHHRVGLLGIALTGYGTEADLERSKTAGFSAHLTKPIRSQELDQALNSLRAA